ncbi:MAG: hypothetical protein US50_C0039G0007 [Candidatus Nomurabacteria bacterium GW2011_GWB1_37_5]|uniref:Transcriptional repressor PaaX-like central Cas2-like domain-containing protein n=1 Tax=Candidatus Nomurabacteria bacterium GW2011_GWB1_37_5 TaxID=1618742 RepID=A0A0G0K252_9BACT|nr:MAG: hypothetical protein US50_C0039G0007 [Candidatus Nomurabacteria bacterium GW2011_GWB1_37_5]
MFPRSRKHAIIRNMGYYLEETTLTDHLIAHIFSACSMRVYRKILWERVQARRNINKSSFDQRLYHLKKNGLINCSDDNICLSKKGISYYNKKNSFRKITKRPGSETEIMVIFDIPEKKKAIRDWFRDQLKDWNFKMIQKSVWKGKGPLPKELDERLVMLGIKKNVQVFKIRKIQ